MLGTGQKPRSLRVD